MNENPRDDGDDEGFLRRHGAAIGIVTVILGAVGGAAILLDGGDGKPAPKKQAEIPMVRITPPPPPPPPPPKLPEPKRDEPEPEEAPPETPMIAQDPVAEEPPPDAPAAAAAEPAAEAMGTSVQGSGDDGFGLAYSRTGGGNAIGGTGTGSGLGTGTGVTGSRWGRYAIRIRNTVTRALSENPDTRAASADIQVRVWADAEGRITRAALVNGTGDAALDDAIRNRVLVGLSLGEAPPPDMPMPIVMRISGRRP